MHFIQRLTFIPLILFFFSVFSTQSVAQDTLVVQTLTLDSDQRAGVFEFPDGTESFEKIIMLYRMRCHDAAVGSGNVGCREWDYSCNTFITDSSRVDSNLALHDNYLITNFSGTQFDASASPTFNYTQYTQHDVSYSDTISEQVIALGPASITSHFGGGKSGRYQYLLSAADLQAFNIMPGGLDGLVLEIQQPGSGTAGFLRVRMQQTTENAIDAAAPVLNDWTEVYFKDTPLDAPGPLHLKFYQEFQWDGTSNILLDLSYTNSTSELPATLHSHFIDNTTAIKTEDKDYNLYMSGAGAVSPDPAGFASIAQEVTVSVWVKGNPDIYPANSTLLEGFDANGRRTINIHLPWSNGQVYWDCGNVDGSYDRINKQANEADYEGVWNHWAFTKNSTTGEMRVYLNGALWHSGNGLTRPIQIESLQLGASNTWNVFYYGNIDEFRVWDKALDETTIREWMHRSLTPDHPDYNSLVCYYNFDEGTGTTVGDGSNTGLDAEKSALPQWRETRGKDRNKAFVSSSMRPTISLVQGEYALTDNTITVLDSVQNTQHRVISFGVSGGDLLTLDTSYMYQAGYMPVFDETGNQIDSVLVGTDQSLQIEQLEYYNKFPAKYEILSLVTPYGNGLDLGPEGKLFTFDVSDFGPILKGEKRLSVEMGGQNQEELDIRFLFIKGTPPREVLDIQNVWPFRRGYFAPIQSDAVFEPRTISLTPASAYKLKASITGHQQNGEFTERQHYLNVNGGANEYEFSVWKECGGIPIYPQGGTWLFDRAGWCPGDPTEVHEFDITSEVTPGGQVEVDYGVLGPDMAEANYLVSTQLVSYGPPNFSLDASVVDVIRPSRKVEHERFNPACNTALIRIQNTGSQDLTSLTITYWVDESSPKTYEWTGSLAFMESAEVELPVDEPSFYATGQTTTGIFHVEVSNPNGGADGYAANNTYESEFEKAYMLLGENVLNYKTNNRGYENSLVVRDHAGNVVIERDNMLNNTQYTDQLDLPPGCYTMEFNDTGHDGLYYWYWAQIGQNVGTGFLKFRRKLNAVVWLDIKVFEPEFGSFVHFDFIVPETVSNAQLDKAQLISVYPNPASDYLQVDLLGFEGKNLEVELINASGQLLERKVLDALDHQTLVRFEVNSYPNGLYFVKVNDGKRVVTKRVVKQ